MSGDARKGDVEVKTGNAGYRCVACRRRTARLYMVSDYQAVEFWDVVMCERETCGATYSVQVPF